MTVLVPLSFMLKKTFATSKNGAVLRTHCINLFVMRPYTFHYHWQRSWVGYLGGGGGYVLHCGASILQYLKKKCWLYFNGSIVF